MSKRGFTAVEMLIALGLVAAVMAIFYQQIGSTINVWRAKDTDTDVIRNVRNTEMFLKNKISVMDKDHLIRVSPAESTEGYIQFSDPNSNIHSIYLNTSANQLVFGPNSFPINSLLYCVATAGVTTSEVVMGDIHEFSLTLFSSTGDMFPTLNVHDPGSIGIKVVKLISSGRPVAMETLVYLRKDNFALPGSIAFGVGGNSFSQDQSGGDLSTKFYDTFTSVNTVATNYVTLNVNQPITTVWVVDHSLEWTETVPGLFGSDKLRYKNKITDDNYYFSADLALEATTFETLGNRASVRLEDSFDPLHNYLDFVIDKDKLCVYKVSDGTSILVAQNNFAAPLDPNIYHNLAIYNNKTTHNLEFYFDLGIQPVAVITNWVTNEGFYCSIVHTRTLNGRKQILKIKNFIISRTPLYNVTPASSGVALIVPSAALEPPSIAPDKIYGMFLSPVLNVNNYLPAHFKTLILKQNANLSTTTLKRTLLYINVNNKGWVIYSPSSNVDVTYNIESLVGSTFQYRFEFRSDAPEPRLAWVSTMNFGW